jgi:hypothetical protein
MLRVQTAMRRCLLAVAGVLCALCTAVAPPTTALAQDPPLKIYSKVGNYDDVKFELQNAIIGRGLSVDFNGQLSKMLDRTGADVGSDKVIYRTAEYFTFCSAKLSRAMMEADTVLIGLCPYVVFMYEPIAASGTISVGYRRLPMIGSEAAKSALTAIDQLLDGIVRDATR